MLDVFNKVVYSLALKSGLSPGPVLRGACVILGKFFNPSGPPFSHLGDGENSRTSPGESWFK